MQTVRLLTTEDKATDDPLGSFLGGAASTSLPKRTWMWWNSRSRTDLAINYQKLIDKGLGDVPREKVDALVRNGLEVTNKDHRGAGDRQGQRVRILGHAWIAIVSADGKVKPDMTPEKKAEGFKKTVNRFLTALENALTDQEYRGGIDSETVARIKEKFQAFEQLFATN